MKIFIKTKQEKEELLLLFISKEFKNKIPNYLNPYKSQIQALFKEHIFNGDLKSSLFLPFIKTNNYKHLLLIGTGEEQTFNYEKVRQISALAYKKLKLHEQKTSDILVEMLISKNTNDWEMLCQAISEGLIMTSYQCNDFKKEASNKKQPLTKVSLSVPAKYKSSCQKGLTTGQILGESVNFVKHLANYPGNFMTPSILANKIKQQTKNTKIQTTIWNKQRIKKEKMGGLFGVSLGSPEEPRFIIMKYKGTATSKKPVIFVGKGLTFDSGGISLKPSQSMDEMKFDMCGAAAVTGAMLAIEKLKLKVNVIGLIPSSENMPGANANKPGDILTARNGKTMEVLNTDAEGRLILADALSYASEQKPQAIFDAATLTGAVIVALSNIFTAVFTKNTNLLSRIQKASDKTGEKIWHLPLTSEHTNDMKSLLADVANIAPTTGGGSSTAAAFLNHFVAKNIPWAHFDIAGTAWNVHNRLEYCSKKMASGVMVRTFVELARSYE